MFTYYLNFNYYLDEFDIPNGENGENEEEEQEEVDEQEYYVEGLYSFKTLFSFPLSFSLCACLICTKKFFLHKCFISIIVACVLRL